MEFREILIALEADKLILLTDVTGILDGSGNLLSSVPLSELEGLLARGEVTGGMIPKPAYGRYDSLHRKPEP